MLQCPLPWLSPLALETLSGFIFQEQEEILRVGCIQNYRGLESYQKSVCTNSMKTVN